MTTPLARPAPREAETELLVLQKWESFTGWFLDHTGKWPKSVRFTLTQRLQNHSLDVTEKLVIARYDRGARARELREVNLVLERMRHLCRLARDVRAMPRKGFESAMRRIDEAGRMLHGWRKEHQRRAGSGSGT